MTSNFPQRSAAHRIGGEAKVLFAHKKPVSWIPTELGGDDDFGFDYMIQVADGFEIRHTFRMQLKGTESPNISVDGKTLSIALKRTTLNYYANTIEPVMLVVAILVPGESGKSDIAKSRVVFCWIHEEIKALRGSRYAVDESDQSTVTVNLAVSDEIQPNLDITPHLEDSLKRTKATETLEQIAERALDPLAVGATALEAFTQKLEVRQTLLPQLLTTDQDSLWVNPEPGSVEHELKEIATNVALSRTDLASAAIERFDKAKLSNPHRLAEFLILEGKVDAQRMNLDRAQEKFAQAHQVRVSDRSLLPMVETEFFLGKDDKDPNHMRELARKLDGVSSDDGVILRSKLFAVAGDFDLAAKEVAKLPPRRQLIPTLILDLVRGESDSAVEVGEQAISNGSLPIEEEAVVRLMLARAHWMIAIGPQGVEGRETPLGGPKNLDHMHARAAEVHTRRSLELFRALGWPLNVNRISDIAAACGTAMGEKEVMLLLKECSAARPEYLPVAEHLELLAIYFGDQHTAIEANRRQQETPRTIARLSMHLFQATHLSDCVASALRVADAPDVSYPQTSLALACGLASAVRTSNVAARIRLEEALLERAEWKEFTWFARYLEASLQSAEQDRAIQILEDGLKEVPDSKLLLGNLFANLSTATKEGAERIITLGRKLRVSMALPEQDCRRIAGAWFTLGESENAEVELRTAIERFGRSAATVALLAASLEVQGKTAEAITLFEEVLQSGTPRRAALRNYLGITLRLGHLEAAHRCISQLLAIEDVRDERLELLRLSALLSQQRGENVDVTIARVQEVGALVDREIESEEGMYINLVMATTLNAAQLKGDFAAEFSSRVDAFCEKWPKSSLFQRFSLPENPSLDALHDILDTVSGNSRKNLRDVEAREQQVRAGQLPIPYVLRPGYALHYVADCFSLWEAAKASSFDSKQFHLNCLIGDEKASPEVRLLRDVPLLDVTSLMLLGDLELLELLLKVYPEIAIPRMTIDFLSQSGSNALASGAARKHSTVILQFINQNVRKIRQPSLNRNLGRPIRAFDVVDDYVEIAGSGGWIAYCDDYVVRALAMEKRAGAGAHLTTYEFVDLAAQQGYLEAREVAEHLSRLCAWNVGILVQHRYLIASLPVVLPGQSLSAQQRLDRFYEHSPFTTLSRAVWNPDKSPIDLVQHMGSVLVVTLSNARSALESVAAIWAFWYLRVKQFSSLGGLGRRLLCYCATFAASQLDADGRERLMEAFIHVVEIDIGSKMSITDEAVALRELGATIAAIGDKNPSKGEELRSKINTSLSPGSARSDHLLAGYAEEIRRRRPTENT